MRSNTYSNKFLSLDGLDDPEFAIPLIGFDPDADANELGPWLSEGTYVASVRLLDADPKQRWQASQKAGHKWAKLVASIEDGTASSKRVFTDVTTFASRAHPITVCSLLFAIGAIRPVESLTTAQQIKRLTEVLVEPYPKCLAHVDWKVTHWDETLKGFFNKIGAKNFPKDPQGKPIPFITAPDGTVVHARNFIRGWRPLANGR